METVEKGVKYVQKLTIKTPAGMTHRLVWKLLPTCSKNSRFGQYANNYLALYVNSPFMYNVEKETNII